jgi:hypothetical protein
VRVNNQLAQQVSIPSTGAGLYDLFAQQTQQASDLLLSQGSLQITYTYLPGGFNSQGWLNFFEMHARRNLVLSSSGQLLFRDWNSVGNNICEFVVSNATSNTQVWDITDPLSPIRMQGNFLANEFRFVNDAARLRDYIAFDPGNALIPVNAGRVQNQDLHNSQQTDYLIITNNLLISQAERLASFHRQRNLKVTVITTDKIFNEFSSGTQDPVAIRDLVKMYFDSMHLTPLIVQNICCFLAMLLSIIKTGSLITQTLFLHIKVKFFLIRLALIQVMIFLVFWMTMKISIQDWSPIFLTVGIGRIPAKNIEEAKNYVDKVIAYHNKESFGAWRNNVSIIADDEDNNLHLQDAELITGTVSANPYFQYSENLSRCISTGKRIGGQQVSICK